MVFRETVPGRTAEQGQRQPAVSPAQVAIMEAMERLERKVELLQPLIGSIVELRNMLGQLAQDEQALRQRVDQLGERVEQIVNRVEAVETVTRGMSNKHDEAVQTIDSRLTTFKAEAQTYLVILIAFVVLAGAILIIKAI